MLRSAILFAAAAGAAEPVDVQDYLISVNRYQGIFTVDTTISVTGDMPELWFLELAPEMTVVPNMTTTGSGNDQKVIPVKAIKGGIVLDMSRARGAKEVTIRCEGMPSERFPKEGGGFVRTAVTENFLYVRSQVAWYPRVPGDSAAHAVCFSGNEEWEVRSAGVRVETERGWIFATQNPVDRVGLVAGSWKVVTDGAVDALVFPGEEARAAALLPLVRVVVEFHAAELGPLPRKRFSLVEMPKEFGSGSGYSECGYILLGPGAFEAGPKADWVAPFLAHEAAHQWWGQDGLFSDFTSEALAEYSTYQFVRATGGADAAARMRKSAADRVSKAAMGGHAAALSDIRGWGEDMDPDAYRVTAYEKSMLLLAAVEDALGPERMTVLLRGFLKSAKESRVGWADLRFALCAAGPEARAAVEKWERAGLPKDGTVPPPSAGEAEARAALAAGMKVANSPAEADPKRLWKAIGDLSAALGTKDLSDGERAAARTGIGRCYFRLGKLVEAEKVLKEARSAGGGGPFHRGWIELRLGNIDDLRGNREAALDHYRAVLENTGASETTKDKASTFIERAYRGFAEDG